MKKILVTVDFSANSRKTIRFAIQLASQYKAEIIFLNIVSLLAPTLDHAWDYVYYSKFQNDQVHRNKNQLVNLIKKLYDSKLPSGVKYTCECQLGNDVGDQILTYAKKSKVNFICVGASGTGVIEKLFGTVATHLITNSPIPVFVIPRNYRLKPMLDLCYASDMKNLESELKKVMELAKSIKTTVKVLHLEYEIELKENHKKLKEKAQKYETKDIKFHYKKLDSLYSMNYNLTKGITQLKPSIVLLFTKQNRKWIERILVSSESAELSFTAKTPLLVYRK
jgi:nucleotide-binding universal stress UspA family protein